MCMCTLDGLPELGCLQICRPHMLKHLDKFCDAITIAHKIFRSKKSLNSCCHVAFQTEMYDTLAFCMRCRPSGHAKQLDDDLSTVTLTLTNSTNTCENGTRKWICQYYRTETTTETECKRSHCRTII